MKAWVTIAVALIALNRPSAAQTSVPIYVSIVMHSEQSARYDLNPLLFEQNRTNLFVFATLLANHGAMFNFQSDWTFLAAVTNYDQVGHAETGGTNIVAWMKWTLGFEIDPHNHVGDSAYNYADVAALISRCGVEPSGVAGGFIALPVTNSQWELFQRTMTGAVYTGFAWTPQALWGSGSGSHVNETSVWFSGVYRPRDGTNFWTDQPGNLPCIGKYAGKDWNWTNLDMLLAMRDAGQLCTGRIYTCNEMTGMGDLATPGFITQFIDQLQLYTNRPNLRWVGLSQITNTWATEYGSTPSYLPFTMTNDVDADGLIDGWEVTNFCGILDSNGGADADGDGQTDADEYLAGTSPTNDADFFAFLGAADQVVRWRSAFGRTYTLEAASNVVSWNAIYTNTGTGPVMSYTNGIADEVEAFRVIVSP